jgi:hypothetical protein
MRISLGKTYIEDAYSASGLPLSNHAKDRLTQAEVVARELRGPKSMFPGVVERLITRFRLAMMCTSIIRAMHKIRLSRFLSKILKGIKTSYGTIQLGVLLQVYLLELIGAYFVLHSAPLTSNLVETPPPREQMHLVLPIACAQVWRQISGASSPPPVASLGHAGVRRHGGSVGKR